MQGDILANIRAAYNQFTKAEKKVADYILRRSKDVVFMSITDLAEACEVGDTSVFRFYKTINMKKNSLCNPTVQKYLLLLFYCIFI